MLVADRTRFSPILVATAAAALAAAAATATTTTAAPAAAATATAAETTAATATAAAAAGTIEAATAAAAARSTCGALTSYGHVESAAIQYLAIERLDRALRVGGVVVFHEAEAPGLPRHAIGHDGGRTNRTIGLKRASQISLGE
jgi:hypothetical protein